MIKFKEYSSGLVLHFYTVKLQDSQDTDKKKKKRMLHPTLKTTNVRLIVTLEENSEDHQSNPLGIVDICAKFHGDRLFNITITIAMALWLKVINHALVSVSGYCCARVDIVRKKKHVLQIWSLQQFFIMLIKM